MVTKKRLIWWGVIAIVVVLVTLGLIRARQSRMPLVQAVEVTRGQLVKVVSASGTVRAEAYVQASAKIPGKIVMLPVAEDMPVVRGQLLARLDNYDQARRDYERLRALAEKGFVPQQQVEQARELVNSAEILSPISGVVTERFMEVGETAVPGAPIVAIADPRTLQIESNVDETDIGAVVAGQPVKVTLDALPGKALTGRVRHIAMESRDLRERGITYLVKIDVDSTAGLRIGMTGDVEITVKKKEDVLKVPLGALLETEGKDVAFVLDGGRVRKKEVRSGLSNYEETEITAGLSEGNTVALGTLDKLKDGQRVRVGK
jgi:RND family efflux transporter MFP subunit